MSVLSAAFTLFLVLDPVGNIPVWTVLLKEAPPERRRWIIFRECLIALAVLLAALFGGPGLLRLLGVAPSALPLAGGVVIFLIALRMIFPQRGGIFGDEQLRGEPFIVPLAIPLLAGPSAVATLMLLGGTLGSYLPLLQAIALAWGASLLILLSAPVVERLLGERGIIAAERLMGMLLTIIAVHLMMTGLEGYLNHTP